MTDVHFHRRVDDEPCVPPSGMTQEQLDFFTEQTVRAVNKARRKDRIVSVTGYLVLVVGLVIALALPAQQANDARQAVVDSGRAVSVLGCNRDYVDRQNFRSILLVFEASAKRQGNDQNIQFWKDVLAVNPQLDCRDAENVLTDDPDAPVPNIPPYYRGAEWAPQPPTLNLDPTPEG